MTELLIPIETALAAATVIGLFVSVPLMTIERHLAEIVAIVKNCPYCMRLKEKERE